MNGVIKQSNDSEVPIETEQMASYFKSLLEGLIMYHINPQPGYEYDSIVDSPITEEEV